MMMMEKKILEKNKLKEENKTSCVVTAEIQLKSNMKR